VEEKGCVSFSPIPILVPDRTYPADCYSLIAIHGPYEELWFFCFGMMPFVCQGILFILMILSVVHPNFGSIEDVDNPDEGFLAKFIPADVAPIVKTTQIMAIFVYVVFADSSLQDIATAANTFPRYSQSTNQDRTRRMALSAILRGIQGILASLSVFLLVFTSKKVIDIILNFTAVNFLSGLDDVAFYLAKSGRFGPNLETEVARIELLLLPRCMFRKNKHVRYFWTVFITGVTLIGLTVCIFIAQNNNNTWTTRTVRVQFQEGTGLLGYNGCYKINEVKNWAIR